MYACVNAMYVWKMHDISKEEPKIKLYVQQNLFVFFIFHCFSFIFFFCYKSNAFLAIIEFIESENFLFVLIWIFQQFFSQILSRTSEIKILLTPPFIIFCCTHIETSG